MATINYTDMKTGEVTTETTADETGLEVGETFRLISQTTEFTAVSFRDDAVFSPTVTGVTKDGRKTTARLADVVRL